MRWQIWFILYLFSFYWYTFFVLYVLSLSNSSKQNELYVRIISIIVYITPTLVYSLSRRVFMSCRDWIIHIIGRSLSDVVDVHWEKIKTITNMTFTLGIWSEYLYGSTSVESSSHNASVVNFSFHSWLLR